jgi:carbon starvation protein CstA
MIIRQANLDTDALAIIDGAKDFVQRISINLLPKKDEAFISAIGRIMTLDGLEVLLAEHNSRIVGGIGIFYTPYLWNQDILVGEELFWWTAKDAPFRSGRMLIDEAMKNIKNKGAIPVFRTLLTSPKGVEKLYKRLGLEPVETVYMSWQ